MDVSGFLGYDAIQRAIDSVAADVSSTHIGTAIVWAKGLAVAFLMINFLQEYLKNLANDKIGGLPVSIESIGTTLFYIALVWHTSEILGLADMLLLEFSNIFINIGEKDVASMDNVFSMWCNQYDESMDAYRKANESGVPLLGEILTAVDEILDALTSSFYGLIFIVIKGLAWLINGIAYPVFLIERGFLLLIMKITAPLIFAMGILEQYRDLVIKWFKVYMAIFLTGLFFVLVTWFCDSIFIHFATNYFSGTITGDNPTTILGGDAGIRDRHAVQVAFYTMVALAKVKLYVTSISISNRLFA